ncbi:MAG: YdcF family protein [Chitinophagaceae bacterium]
MLQWQQNKTELSTTKTYDAAIVLGGFAAFDTNDSGYFNAHADRFIQTLQLYHQKKIKKIIISGGTGTLFQKEPPEATFVRKEFLACGVPDSALIIESASRNTYENALFSKKIIDSLHIKLPIVVVTSAFHCRRTKPVFLKAGIPVVLHPCAYRVIDSEIDFVDYFVPSLYVINEWPLLIKEMLGLFTYQLTGKA